MPNIDYSKALAYTPQTSKAKGQSIEQHNYKNEKNKKNNQSSLRDAAQGNPIPVVVLDGAPVASFVLAEQTSRQVYVIQSRIGSRGEITECLLARMDSDGELTIVSWCDVAFIDTGLLSDALVTVEVDQSVQSEPLVETINTKDEDNRTLESFIFFDPYGNSTTEMEKITKEIEKALGMQRDVAKFMNLYDGNGEIDKRQQAKIDKQIHLVPLTDLPEDILAAYPVLRACDVPGINGNPDEFVRYWNEHVYTSKVHVFIIRHHANQKVIVLHPDTERLKIKHISLLKMPPIDYCCLLGCNIGDLSDAENFAFKFTAHTVGSNPVRQEQGFWESFGAKEYKVYPTAVVAADGKTSSTIIQQDGYVVGLNYKTGKYDPKDDKIYIEGKGFCVFFKGSNNVKEIPNTRATPPLNWDELSYQERAGDKGRWSETNISVEKLLQEAERFTLELE